MKLAGNEASIAGDGRAAGTVENIEEGSLRSERAARFRVKDRIKHPVSRRVVCSRGQADGALSDRGQEVVDLEESGSAVSEPKSLEPGVGEQSCIDFAALGLA